jgi:hypothetical protein
LSCLQFAGRKEPSCGAAFVWLCAVAGTVLYLPVLVLALVADPGPAGLDGSRVDGRHRDGLRQAWTSSRLRAAGVGLLSPLAYVLILYALAPRPGQLRRPRPGKQHRRRHAARGFVLHEKDMGRRLVSAVAILLDVVVLTLGWIRVACGPFPAIRVRGQAAAARTGARRSSATA